MILYPRTLYPQHAVCNTLHWSHLLRSRLQPGGARGARGARAGHVRRHQPRKRWWCPCPCSGGSLPGTKENRYLLLPSTFRTKKEEYLTVVTWVQKVSGCHKIPKSIRIASNISQNQHSTFSYESMLKWSPPYWVYSYPSFSLLFCQTSLNTYASLGCTLVINYCDRWVSQT